MANIDNKRIAKNAIFLYIRTFFVLIVSLYTSRLILQILGATDLGIYNVVGGIVTLMAFFQAAQSKATSRFITYELGVGQDGKPQRVFSICMTIHILIAIVVFILAETVGLWLVNTWIKVPPERIFAANIVYQFSILTFCIHLIQVPLGAVIIAHENMSVYAYISILEVVLKLVSVSLLFWLGSDKLIFYALFISLVALSLFVIYTIYINRKYPLYKFKWTWDPIESKKILSFSGWTLLGSSANTATQQGVSILFNNFIGLVANAALGFAGQVNSSVTQFVHSFSTAFNPQVIRLCAQEDYNSLHLLMTRASKFSFVLGYIFALPLIVNMEFVLNLWLGDVPQYTVEFCQLILVCTVIDSTTGVYNTAITASGRIKYYQIGISISFLLDLVCAFILLRIGLHPAIVFGSRIMTRGVINMFIGLYFCRKQLYFDVKKYARDVLLPVIATVVITVLLLMPFFDLEQSWYRFFITLLVSTISIILSTICLIFNKSELNFLYSFIKSKIK